MMELIHGYYAYALVLLLLVVGLSGMLTKQNLIKKLLGMAIFQSAIILFFIVGAYKWGATVPVADPSVPVGDANAYINPLPHTLMLTAIVVGVATQGVALALAIAIYQRFGTLNETALLERMK